MKYFIYLVVSLSISIFFIACQTTNHIEENPIDSDIQQNTNKDEVVDSTESDGKIMYSTSVSISNITSTENGEKYLYTYTYPDGKTTQHTSNMKRPVTNTYGEIIYNFDGSSYEEYLTFSSGGTTVLSNSSTSKMADGEVVTYTFTYPDGKTTQHTITKVTDDNIYGDIIYDFDDTTYHYVISEDNIKSYINETSFLLYGSLLSSSVEKEREKEEKYFGTDTTVSGPPPFYTSEGCNESIVNVIAGEFPANICTYYSEDNNTFLTKYSHSNSLEDAKPLDGLFKEERIANGEVTTVELTYWNGL